MKIACVYPRRPHWPKSQWVHEALTRLGHAVRRVDDARGLDAADRECDLVLFEHKAFGVGRKVVESFHRSFNSQWVTWWFDLFSDPDHPLESQGTWKLCGSALHRCDLVLVKDSVDRLRDRGVNARWMDQGCPVDMPPIRPETPKRWDVLVWGQGGVAYRQRSQDVRALLNAGFRVGWAGKSGSVPRGVERLPWTHPMDLPDLASQATCVLSVDRRSDIPGYWSDRIWLALGMGTHVLMRKVRRFPETDIVNRYVSPEGLVEHARRICEVCERNPTWYRRKSEQVRERIMDRHTIGHRCLELLASVSARTAAAAAS